MMECETMKFKTKDGIEVEVDQETYMIWLKFPDGYMTFALPSEIRRIREQELRSVEQ
jgi:hypothetical protein